MHPETEIESQSLDKADAADEERLAVLGRIGERAIGREQAGVELDATIEEMQNVVAEYVCR